MSEEPPRSANLLPGYDEEDHYEAMNISTYPGWWRRNIEEFREHDLRPYRPPRFADGEITTERIKDLEEELGVDIRFQAINPQLTDNWDLVVGQERVTTVENHREGEGYSQYSITASEFEALVRESAEEQTTR